MASRFDRWIQQARALYPIARQSTPKWLRPMLAGCIGAAVAVFLGWVDTHGDAIRIYLALVGVILAASAAFVSGRVINEAADKRELRRKMNAAIVKMEIAQIGINILEKMLTGIEERLPDRLPTAAELRSLNGQLYALALYCDESPDFSSFLDNDADVKHARIVTLLFVRFRLHRTSPSRSQDQEERQERMIEAIANDLVLKESHHAQLQEAITHFKKRRSEI